jgi:predicted house-cleaning NTP pyrophosphatase (Maf/HAM1 superfamily)
MLTEELAAARRSLMTSVKMLEALAASPQQDEDVNRYAVQCFDRAAVLYVQRLGRERAEEVLAERPQESGPRYSSEEGARANAQTTASRSER